MDTLAIILCAVGLLSLPVGRLYMIWQARRPGSRMADSGYARRFMNIVRMASLVVCCLAMLILWLMQKN